MEGGSSKPCAGKAVSPPFGFYPRTDINQSGPTGLLSGLEQKRLRVAGCDHGVLKIRSAHGGPMPEGMLKSQLKGDVFKYRGSRSGGECSPNRLRGKIPQDANGAIGRPEVVTPLRYAVGLIDRNRPDGEVGRPGLKKGMLNAFRRDV